MFRSPLAALQGITHGGYHVVQLRDFRLCLGLLGPQGLITVEVRAFQLASQGGDHLPELPCLRGKGGLRSPECGISFEIGLLERIAQFHNRLAHLCKLAFAIAPGRPNRIFTARRALFQRSAQFDDGPLQFAELDGRLFLGQIFKL